MTLEITILSMVIGLAIAMVLAVWRHSNHRILRAISASWVELARNTPALLQIYMAYFGLGAFQINVSAYTAVLSAIAFNNAGYLAEIVRGGLETINRQQRWAARSLGMTQLQAYRHIIFPQVLRLVFGPIMNQVIWAMLGTSLGMIIGLNELTGETAFQQSLTFRPFEFFFAAAVIYYALAKAITLGSKVISLRYFRY